MPGTKSYIVKKPTKTVAVTATKKSPPDGGLDSFQKYRAKKDARDIKNLKAAHELAEQKVEEERKKLTLGTPEYQSELMRRKAEGIKKSKSLK